MRVRFRMLIWTGAVTVAVTAAEGRAAEQGAGLQYQQSPGILGDQREAEATTFWGRFKVAFDQRAPAVFEDQFQPFNFINWNVKSADGDFNDLLGYHADAARHALSDALGSSARDAALELDLPALEWLRKRQGFVADFLWNSLDSVEEQSVSPLNPSYRSLERSWWQELSEGGGLRCGVRPFRTDPYAFLSWRIKDRDSVRLLGHARYYFRNFGDHCFELALSTPIERGFSIQLGTSYQFGTHEAKKKVVLKLLKSFKSGSILHVALEARQTPQLIAGITVPW